MDFHFSNFNDLIIHRFIFIFAIHKNIVIFKQLFCTKVDTIVESIQVRERIFDNFVKFVVGI